MAEEDEDKTAFYTGEGVFYYKKMPFGLKNAGATYQRFRSINMKLNPKKCSFGVEEGPSWDTSITKHGIKANPLKVKAVADLDQPRTLKYIQSLNGKLAALSQFLSKGVERSLAFFKKGGKRNANRFLGQDTPEDKEKKEKPKEVLDSSSKWRLYTDGASNSDGSGAGLMLIDLEGKEYTYALRFKFETTNNEAEYEALLAGLRIAHEMEIAKVAIFLDSQLLVNQIKGTFAAKQTLIKDYLQKVKTVLRGFEDYTVKHVRRNQNKKADALSKLASMTFEHLTKEVLVEVLTKMSIEENKFWREVAKVIQDCKKCKENRNKKSGNKQSHIGEARGLLIRSTCRDGEGFTRSAGEDIGFKDGAEEEFAVWEVGHIKFGSLKKQASVTWEASSTTEFQ
ncbi:reverse transcriptase domain-containing protein [Tanacetum coccineum]